MLKTTKRGIYGLASRARVFNALQQSDWRRRRLLVLCYHGVSLADEHEWNSALYMPQDALRARFALLRSRGYNVLPLDEAVRRLYEGTLPRASVALTFDDGMYDFYARAIPVLEEFGYPATVYVPTYYCRYQRPVFGPICGYVAWKGRAAGSCDSAGLTRDGAPLQVSTGAEREATARRLAAAALEGELDAREKDAMVEEFAARLGVDYAQILADRVLHIMSPDEVRDAATRGVDVQLHTHRHRTPDDAMLFARELHDNKRELAEMTGSAAPMVHFCYPSGEYRASFLPWLREAGIESATTCDPGLATSADDPLLLPRFVDTAHQCEATFEAWTSGFALTLPRRARPRLA